MNDKKMRRRNIRPLRLFFDILRQSHTYKLLIGYIVFVFVIALLILITDKNINTFGDALWYCYAVLSTVGFGDITVTGTLPRLLSLVLTVYSVVVIAIITGAIVNLYTRITEIDLEETMDTFINELENLQELDREELKSLSARVIEFRKRLHKE